MYCRNVGKLVKETISTRWQGIKFFEHVLLVISIPAKFDDRAKDTMRKCFHNAGLTNSKESNKWEKRKTFKLHLEIPQNEKPPLPYQLSYEKTITRKGNYFYGIKFFEYVLLVISVPAEFERYYEKMSFNAGLTDSKESKKVEFTTEPEAAAVYCMRNLKNLKGQNEIIPVNAPFMIVDCRGGTVDLTTRRLLRNKKVKVSGITELKIFVMDLMSIES
uniref:Uncharacterized protein n=4 Tax=Rhizophagus irregularis TaxID=588596 RepID=U9USG6_RHIID